MCVSVNSHFSEVNKTYFRDQFEVEKLNSMYFVVLPQVNKSLRHVYDVVNRGVLRNLQNIYDELFKRIADNFKPLTIS